MCSEAQRLLRRGDVCAIYDIMRGGEGDLDFPVPLAETPETSFAVDPASYRRALDAAGFDVTAERNRTEFALEFFQRMKTRVAESGPPPLGIHILLGRDASKKVGNMIAHLQPGFVAPVEMICRRREEVPEGRGATAGR